MMDKITLLCIVFAVIPLAYMLWAMRHEIRTALRYRRISGVGQPSALEMSEYDRILAAVKDVEMEYQPNSGKHHSEETYLNRAELLRRETHLYKLINSL